MQENASGQGFPVLLYIGGYDGLYSTPRNETREAALSARAAVLQKIRSGEAGIRSAHENTTAKQQVLEAILRQEADLVAHAGTCTDVPLCGCGLKESQDALLEAIDAEVMAWDWVFPDHEFMVVAKTFELLCEADASFLEQAAELKQATTAALPDFQQCLTTTQASLTLELKQAQVELRRGRNQ